MRCTIHSLAMALLCVSLLGTTGAFAERIVGDVDGSGRVNATDVQLVINAALGLYGGELDADINSDLRIGAADVQLSINAVLGKSIVLPNPPTADFEATPRGGLSPVAAEFTDRSVAGDAPIESWSWEFGDGTGSTERNPTHVYAADGVYSVRLTVRAGALGSRCLKRSFISATTLRVDSFAINGGAEVTTSRTVTLDNACTGAPLQYAYTTWGFFTQVNTHWMPYSSAPVYTLPAREMDGRYGFQLDFKVRDADGNESNVVRSSIVYDTGNIAGRVRTYGESPYDKVRDMHTTTDGGLILAGVTYKQVWEAGSVYWHGGASLIKTDAAGTVEWTKTLGEPERTEAYSVQQTLDGGYVVAGQIVTPIVGSDEYLTDVYVAKTDAAGSLEWSQVFGESSGDRAKDIKQTTDGGYILAGTAGSTELERGLFLLKLDGDGRKIWAKGYEKTLGLEGSFGLAVLETPDAGYLLTGTAYMGDWMNNGIPLVKTDSEGNVLWWRFLRPNGEFCGANDIQPTPDGAFAIVGLGMEYYDTSYVHMLLIKIDADGNVIWSRNLFPGYSGEAFTQTSDGGFVVAGNRYRQPEDIYNWRHTAVAKADSEGNAIWRRAQGRYLLGRVYAVQETANGNYAVAGERLNDELTPEWEGGSFWFQMDPERNYVELAE